MKQKRREAGACVHRWRLAEPAGAWSRGVCRLCGAERKYANVFAGDMREVDWAGKDRPARESGT